MDIDSLETVKSTEPDDKGEPLFAAYHKLNCFIAITIALLATFMGICKVKDDNIVQAMQQAQANKPSVTTTLPTLETTSLTWLMRCWRLPFHYSPSQL